MFKQICLFKTDLFIFAFRLKEAISVNGNKKPPKDKK